MKTRLLPVIFLLLLLGCSTTEKTADSDRSGPFIDITDEMVDNFAEENLDDFERMLLATRSQLSDQFSDLEHDMPEIFLREAVRRKVEVDEYAGYRVQIISTRDVVQADTTKHNFVAWADSTFEGIQTDAYVLFRQPYYRVHAGDFRDRDMANEFSRLIKQKYPNAWVVHDRIEPAKVPADTAQIRLKEQETDNEDTGSLQSDH